MTNELRKILLFPLSIVYGFLVGVRNFLYNKGFKKSVTPKIPVIVIGNLAVGGTGKTPHSAFVIEHLQSKFKTAFLSRGYRRKTKGFMLASADKSFEDVGDEPYQIHRTFPSLPVAVDENRLRGIDSLCNLYPETELVVLDDAFQHRKLRAGLSILLTDYRRIYTRDLLLPSGNLREGRKGARRADVIIVTKCPADITPIDMRVIELELKPRFHQQLYFSCYEYLSPEPLIRENQSLSISFEWIKNQNASVLLLTGIVNPGMIVDHLNQYTQQVIRASFPDHHDFGRNDLSRLEKQFNRIENDKKIILTTEKDATRLINNKFLPDQLKNYIFVLPVKVKILDNKEEVLIQKLTDYVTENSGNR